MSYNNSMSSEMEDTNLKMVGLELMFLTPEKCSSADGITAVELAKLVNLPVETTVEEDTEEEVDYGKKEG